jgi:hypothetical protein
MRGRPPGSGNKDKNLRDALRMEIAAKRELRRALATPPSSRLAKESAALAKENFRSKTLRKKLAMVIRDRNSVGIAERERLVRTLRAAARHLDAWLMRLPRATEYGAAPRTPGSHPPPSQGSSATTPCADGSGTASWRVFAGLADGKEPGPGGRPHRRRR